MFLFCKYPRGVEQQRGKRREGGEKREVQYSVYGV